MSKNDISYVCSNCGASYLKWSGQCLNCNQWNTLEEEVVYDSQKNALTAGVQAEVKIQKLKDIRATDLTRTASGFGEVDRVLGGEKNKGFVKGQVVLLSGDPGIGKSTILLQILNNLAKGKHEAIYVSAEESAHQIALRAERIGGKSISSLKIVSGFDVDAIIGLISKENPEFVVIDSIQTISTQDVRGMAGGIAQVKACTGKLVNFAKAHDICMVIVGHINKEGNVAGPKTLEHLVDTVLHLEGDKRGGFRIIRSLKNRFGSTDEVGILGMDSTGMVDLDDASKYFVSDDDLEGVARGAILEGNRILIVEVQSLVSPSAFAMPKRVAEGISLAKLQVILAILQKHSKIRLADKDVYVNIAGGLKIKDPSIDLAIAASIVSSVKSKKINNNKLIVGELSLTGKVGLVRNIGSREKEIRRLGYKEIIDNRSLTNISRIADVM